MLYRICKLHFSTPVRFGSDDGGDSNTGARMNAHADTLFSALYISLLPAGRSEELRTLIAQGRLTFSDCLPYDGDTLYIPRPMGSAASSQKALDPAQRKLYKKLEYIPFGSLAEFLDGTADPAKLRNDFGVMFDSRRVNLRDFKESQPYSVTGFRFKDNCGLYIVISARDETSLSLFDEGMQLLSSDGFGGRSSSGWGKFTYTIRQTPAAFETALDNAAAPGQLLLACALPDNEEADPAMNGARYMLVRRGGFSSGVSSAVRKRRTVYMLSAGSVFRKRFNGTMVDTNSGGTHPVWRCARGIFMGVNV